MGGKRESSHWKQEPRPPFLFLLFAVFFAQTQVTAAAFSCQHAVQPRRFALTSSLGPGPTSFVFLTGPSRACAREIPPAYFWCVCLWPHLLLARGVGATSATDSTSKRNPRLYYVCYYDGGQRTLPANPCLSSAGNVPRDYTRVARRLAPFEGHVALTRHRIGFDGL